jgi:hypothetical protein
MIRGFFDLQNLRNIQSFIASDPESMPLDGFEAISTNEIDLKSFNHSVIFVQEEDL